MAPPILILRDVRLAFGGTPLLDGVAFQIQAGERLCLLGRNGSGKSTLLRIAAGQIEPDSGERFVQPGTTIRYLSQEPDLSGYSSTQDYVADGLAPGDDPHQARQLLEGLGLNGGEDPAILSGGEIRRCALARTLAPRPDILILDEPTRWISPVSSTRRSFACCCKEIFAISSRKSVPWCANSKHPIRSALASVNAPFTCPNNSLSNRPSGKPPALTATNVFFARSDTA